VDALLTRRAVARRLGKSVAAIRAIEGALLHPSQGPNGVRLFDADEVERLAGRPLGVNAHSKWFRMRLNAQKSATRAGRSSEVERLRRQVAGLSEENAELRAALAEFIGASVDAFDC
jgi:transposase-like protein